MAKKKKAAELLVLCVDRDDDLGRKTGKKGPVVGREANVEAATALALADPADSDSNTIFEAVRTYDELKSDKRDVVVATVTGDADVGVRSDTKFAKQLDDVLDETGATEVILVTDGAQDEHLIPLVQSRAEITAIRRVVMKQSERLEGMYQMIHDFVDDPRMSKIFLGVPALAFLLLAVFGTAGWRVIIGGIGAYLFVKGFRMESRVDEVVHDLSDSLKMRRMSLFFYIASVFILLVGLKGGFDFIRVIGPVNSIETVAAFINGSIFLNFIAFTIALIGRLLDVKSKKKEVAKYITYGSLGLGVSLVGFEASSVILTPETGFVRLFAAIAFGLFVVGAARAIERLV